MWLAQDTNVSAMLKHTAVGKLGRTVPKKAAIGSVIKTPKNAGSAKAAASPKPTKTLDSKIITHRCPKLVVPIMLTCPNSNGQTTGPVEWISEICSISDIVDALLMLYDRRRRPTHTLVSWCRCTAVLPIVDVVVGEVVVVVVVVLVVFVVLAVVVSMCRCASLSLWRCICVSLLCCVCVVVVIVSVGVVRVCLFFLLYLYLFELYPF